MKSVEISCIFNFASPTVMLQMKPLADIDLSVLFQPTKPI